MRLTEIIGAFIVAGMPFLMIWAAYLLTGNYVEF